jgi:hypothetical protein
VRRISHDIGLLSRFIFLSRERQPPIFGTRKDLVRSIAGAVSSGAAVAKTAVLIWPIDKDKPFLSRQSPISFAVGSPPGQPAAGGFARRFARAARSMSERRLAKAGMKVASRTAAERTLHRYDRAAPAAYTGSSRLSVALGSPTGTRLPGHSSKALIAALEKTSRTETAANRSRRAFNCLRRARGCDHAGERHR